MPYSSSRSWKTILRNWLGSQLLKPRKRRGRNTPQTEELEARTLLSAFTVTTTANDGPGSLRQAIIDANANSGSDTIEFNIPTTDSGFVDVDSALPGGDVADDAFVIQLLSPLPAISDSTGGTIIDGRTQTTFSGDTNPFGPELILDGSGSNLNGFFISSDNNGVYGLNIRGFSGFGVAIQGGTNNTVAGNYIGTDATGTVAVGNGSGGVRIDGQNNLIGTDGDGIADDSERNVISGNSGWGVVLFGSGTSNNVIAGNDIGTDVSGTAALSNSGFGVFILGGAHHNLIGTDGDGTSDAAERNVISGNNDRGIWMSGSGTDHNTIAGNYIGVDKTGTVDLGNGSQGFHSGITIASGPKFNLVGTDGDGTADDAERNVISGNTGYGVLISGAGADANVVAGNYIGTNATGTASIGNDRDGVAVRNGAKFNIIGTNGNGSAGDLAEGNLISGNNWNGVYIGDSGSNDNVVAGNYIGTDATGALAIANGRSGISVGNGAMSNRIGTNADGVADGDEANVIAFNTSSGVAVSGADTTGNAVRGNSIYSNGGLGIDLIGGIEDAFGVTANDQDDLDVGPNDLQNTPEITLAKVTMQQVLIEGQLHSTPNATFEIDLYANDAGTVAGSEEGERFLTSLSVVTDANGDAAFSVTLPQSAVSTGELVTATATDSTGNTSEFSSGLVTVTPPTSVEVDGLGNLVILDNSEVGSEVNNTLRLELVETASGVNVRVSDPDNELNPGAGTTVVDDHTVDIPLASITGSQGIVIDTSHGDDSLTIVYDPAMAFPKIDFTAGDQSATGPGDSLIFAGTVNRASFSIYDDTTGQGSVSVDSQRINYRGVEPMTSRLSVSDISIFTHIRDSFSVMDGGLGSTAIVFPGGHPFDFIHPTDLLHINTGLNRAPIELRGLGDGFDANVELWAGDVDVTGPVDLGTGWLTMGAIGNAKGTWPIVLGTGAGGEFDLTDADLDRINASSIQLNVFRNASITVIEPINPAHVDTLHLSGGTISQTTGSLQVTSLALSSYGDVEFSSATNDVTNLAISASGNAIFTDADTLNVADVGTISGVSASGSVQLNALSGPLTIQETSAVSDVSGFSVSFNVLGNDQTFRVETGADVKSIDTIVNADKVDLQGTITAGKRVSFQTLDAVNLGSTTDSIAETLELSDAELNRISAVILQIGGYAADGSFSGGPIEVTQFVNPASVNTLSLITGGTIDDGTTGALNVPNLAIRSVGSAVLDNWELGNSVGVLAAEITGRGGRLRFENDGGLTVGTVDGVVGVTTNGGGSIVRTHSPLTINEPVTDLGGGDITLIAGESGSEEDDLIISAPISTSGGDGSITLSAGDDIQIDDQVGDELSVAGAGSITITAEDEVDLAPGVTLETEQGTPEISGGSVGISGTELDDQIEVIPTADGLQLEVFRDGILIATASSEGRVKIHGLGGNDTIAADKNITADLWFDGGTGNDRLKGAEGNDVLLGGDGDDLLVGKSGRDLLVGGTGADRIVGNADDDILISGFLDFGADPLETAVSYVMLEWTSARTYEQRMRNLIDGSGTANRDNDNYFLQWMNTVQDDQEKDVLTGSAGSDWFFANFETDRVTDLKDEAFADEWEFIVNE